jgi:hypothetical protein
MLRVMRVIVAVLLLVPIAPACKVGSGSDTPIGIDAAHDSTPWGSDG